MLIWYSIAHCAGILDGNCMLIFESRLVCMVKWISILVTLLPIVWMLLSEQSLALTCKTVRISGNKTTSQFSSVRQNRCDTWWIQPNCATRIPTWRKPSKYQQSVLILYLHEVMIGTSCKSRMKVVERRGSLLKISFEWSMFFELAGLYAGSGGNKYRIADVSARAPSSAPR